MSVLEEIDAQWAKTFEAISRAYAGPGEEDARLAATPQDMYAEKLRQCPVRDLGDGLYAVWTMADVQYITRHPAVKAGTVYLGSDRPAIPLGIDGGEHRKYRRILDPVFAPKRVAALADGVAKLAAEMIEDFAADGRVEVYHRWCEPLPASIFLSIMGLPQDELADFVRFKNYLLNNEEMLDLTQEEQTARRHEGEQWLNAYFAAELDARERRADPGDDMIGLLITSEVDGHRLTRDELLGILGLLMIAGLDTVAGSLACILSYLARHPDDRRRIVAEP